MKLLSAEFTRKFKSEKRLRPGDYDFSNYIYPALKERPRFEQVVSLIENLDNNVSNELFSESYTNHYFIHCPTLNDGLVAAVAICNMIYKKYTYEIGDYLVDKSSINIEEPIPINTGLKMISMAVSNDCCVDSDDDFDETDSDESNASIFLYNPFIHSDIFAYDSTGIKVCFVIYAEDKIKHDNEMGMNGLFQNKVALSPQQAATQLHYTYINIPSDKSEEIVGMITDHIAKSGFTCENVKKQIKALSQNSLITDEYTALAAAKHVINNHIQRFNGLTQMLPVDFCDYVRTETVSPNEGNKIRLI